MKNNAQLINADSGNFEYYTPHDIVDRARLAMGSIDLDPFSSEAANNNVKASKFYTKEDNGFEKSWYGNIWVNHPFSRENNPKIFDKAIREYELGNADQICLITYASTSEGWFRKSLDFPQCYLYKRTNYLLPDGTVKKGVTKGSVVTYIGNNEEEFYKHFKDIGKVKVAYG